MNVLILHNPPEDDSRADELDVLVQVEAVQRALQELGHRVSVGHCTLNLAHTEQLLVDSRPDLVFNLVESLNQTDRLAPLVALLLDSMGISYTGNHAWALHQSNGKLLAKQRLFDAGLPTAEWIAAGQDLQGPAIGAQGEWQWILKPVWEHASFGMDQRSVIAERSVEEIHEEQLRRQQNTGRPHFAERFIDGREFNLSLLAGTPACGFGDSDLSGSVQVLPAAEIEFHGFDDSSPRIVGHRAKWDPGSSEYRNTPRQFEFHDRDRHLLSRLRRLAVRCWKEFDLRGYARVDFRVDNSGQPWILEINTNPCLSPDAGFAAAAARCGIDFQAVIQRIVFAACLDTVARPVPVS